MPAQFDPQLLAAILRAQPVLNDEGDPSVARRVLRLPGVPSETSNPADWQNDVFDITSKTPQSAVRRETLAGPRANDNRKR